MSKIVLQIKIIAIKVQRKIFRIYRRTNQNRVYLYKERILTIVRKVGIEANRKESRLEILDKLLNQGVTI